MAYAASVNGRATESDQRHTAVELAAQQANRLEHVTERDARLEHTQPLHVGGRPDRIEDGRPLALHEIEIEAQRREGQQQIGEEDGRVDLDDVDRLQRHRDGQLRLAADLDQREALAQGAVVRHVAPGLAHEPHGCHVDGLATARPEEPVVHAVHAGHELMRVFASAIRSSSHRGLKRIDAPSDCSSCCVGCVRK